MIHARINHGMVELQDPIPEAWEGLLVKLVPLTPDDDIPDLEERLAAFHALGPRRARTRRARGNRTSSE